DANFVDARQVAKIGDGSERERDLVAHRGAGIKDDIKHPGMALAARHHDIGAIASAARSTRERPLAWSHALKRYLERHLPSGAADPAHRPVLLLRRACVGPATAHRAHGLGERHTSGGEIPDRTGALGLVRTIVREHLALAPRVEHIAHVSGRGLPSRAEHLL